MIAELGDEVSALQELLDHGGIRIDPYVFARLKQEGYISTDVEIQPLYDLLEESLDEIRQRLMY